MKKTSNGKYTLGRKLVALPPNAHWGNMLVLALNAQHKSLRALALESNRSGTVLYRSAKRVSTDSAIVWEMGKLLDVDFFAQYSRAFAPEKWAASEAGKAADKAENTELRAKVADLEKEIQVLRSLLK